MAIHEGKPKSRRSRIFKVIKWCAKWAATAGGLLCIIYIFNDLQSIAIIYVLGILFIFSLIFAPRSEQIRIIRFFPKIFIPIFILCISICAFIFTTILYFPLIGSKTASGLTKEEILSLKLDMKKDEVINILGAPVKTVNEDSDEYTHFYATPGLYGLGHEFYLDFIDNKLVGIIIELDDFLIYSCNKYECPGIIKPVRDSYTLEEFLLNSSN